MAITEQELMGKHWERLWEDLESVSALLERAYAHAQLARDEAEGQARHRVSRTVTRVGRVKRTVEQLLAEQQRDSE